MKFAHWCIERATSTQTILKNVLIGANSDELDEDTTALIRSTARDPNIAIALSALEQHNGYGTKGSTWISPRGNMHLSIAIPFAATKSIFAIFPLYVGVVLHKIVAEFVDKPNSPPIGLKWPNDIIIGECKIGGVIAETLNNTDSHYLLAGIGINIAHKPQMKECDRQSERVQTYSTETINLEKFTDRVVKELLGQLQHYLTLSSVITKWTECASVGCCGIGSSIHVRDSEQKLIFKRLDEFGGCVVDENGVERVLRAEYLW